MDAGLRQAITKKNRLPFSGGHSSWEKSPEESAFTLETVIEMAYAQLSPDPLLHLDSTYPPTAVPMGVGWGSSAPWPRNPHQVSSRGQGASLIFCKLNPLLIRFVQSVLLAPWCLMTFHGLFYFYPSNLSHQLLSPMLSNLEVDEETLGSSLGCHLWCSCRGPGTGWSPCHSLVRKTGKFSMFMSCPLSF